MTEQEYMKLRCAGPYPENTGVKTYEDKGSGVPSQYIYLCSGSQCAAWEWDKSPQYCAELNRNGDYKFEPEGHCTIGRGV